MKNLAAALVLATVLAVPSLACAKDLTIAAPIATYRLLVAGANERPSLAEANGLDALFMVPGGGNLLELGSAVSCSLQLGVSFGP